MKAIIITVAVFLVLAIGMMGYVIGLSHCVNTQIVPVVFTNGQILYPDYVHSDTLVVNDADYLNACMNDGKLKSDGDIMEILNETTINKPVNYKP